MRWFNKKRFQKVAVVLIAAFFISQLLLLIFEKDFNTSEWQKNPQERYQMVDDIIESQLLIGKSYKEIMLLLGEPDITFDKTQFQIVYRLGNAPSFTSKKEAELVISFKDNLVFKVTENKF